MGDLKFKRKGMRTIFSASSKEMEAELAKILNDLRNFCVLKTQFKIIKFRKLEIYQNQLLDMFPQSGIHN